MRCREKSNRDEKEEKEIAVISMENRRDRIELLSTYQVLYEVDQIMKHVAFWKPYTGTKHSQAAYHLSKRNNYFGQRTKKLRQI